MIVRSLEAFFRYKWLILLPPILIPLIVGPIAVLRAASYYEAGASVWVDRATYLTSTDGFNNPYASPAQQQNGRLQEYLRTRPFLMSIASRTALAPLVGNEAGERTINTVFFRGFGAAPVSDRILLIRFRASNPQLAVQMVNATIEAFKDKVTADRLGQANLATSFYEGQLKTAEGALTKANDALRRYVAANPRLTNIDPERGAAATTASRLGLPADAIDPQLADLLRQVDQQQADVNRIRTALELARMDSEAAIQGQDVGFQVVDPPQLPTRLLTERRKALIFPVAGLGVGLVLGAALLVLLVATDRAARSEADLAAFGRVVGTVPRLRLTVKGLSKASRQDVTRRAIAFAAGTALPSPSGAK
jgi:uncharacterized protein involved in exopolysaccharide biosynthesis